MMRTRKLKKVFLGIVACVALPIASWAQQGESHVGKYTGHADAGKQLYYRYCWGCHGFRGDGNGENWLPTGSFAYGPYLNIQPRNFVAATFKCRSTTTGTFPTDHDLYNTPVRGGDHSNMASSVNFTAP